jgi:chemotaxis protein methyltransferase CheR
VDVRIISATNRSLEEYIQTNRFREDLFYRLNVYPITVPPLRNRTGDIQILVNHFIARLCKKMNRDFKTISKHDMNQLTEYHWPGNVRELENIIERAIITSEEPTLHFEIPVGKLRPENDSLNGRKTMEDAEREHIIHVLDDCNWRINGKDGAAEKLNLPPSTLRSRMKKLNINRPT